jgi:hypothetical protein
LDLILDLKEKEIVFDIKTDNNYTQKNFSKLLICLFFLFFVKSDYFKGYRIEITSISRTTEWIMMNYFNLVSSEKIVNDYFTRKTEAKPKSEKDFISFKQYNSYFEKNEKKLDNYEFSYRSYVHFYIERDDSKIYDYVNHLHEPFLEEKLDELIKNICP